MQDSMLGKLILRRIGVDGAACERALSDGAVVLADLDPKNETHQEGVGNWLDSIQADKLAPIPPEWLPTLSAHRIMRLSAVMPEAQARMAKSIRDGFNIEKLIWHGPVFPAAWSKAIEKVLLDKPDWDKFHAVQDKLPVDTTARLRKELATKMAEAEQKEKEAKKAARGKMPPKVDALEESIRKRQTSRLAKLPLEKLTKVRWEAYKDEWIKAPSEILALAAKVPEEFYRPYEAKILAAVAENCWEPMPKWTVTKSCLQELEVRYQATFLRNMFCALIDDVSFNSVVPEFTWQEIRNLMVAATLLDSDNLRLSRWIDALDTFKYFRSIKVGGVRLSKEEEAQFRLAAPGGDGYLSADTWLRGSEDDDTDNDVELVLDLLAWAKSQPKEKHPAYGAILRRNHEVEQLFGSALKADIK